MENIGVILPATKEKGFFKRFKWENVGFEDYHINFVVVRDNQNCSKIFNRNNVERIVILTDCEVEECNFEILTGDVVYKRMLPDYARRLAKGCGNECSVTLVDKSMGNQTEVILNKLCDVCKSVNVNTHNLIMAEKMADYVMEKYGLVLGIVDDKRVIDDDIVVVVEDCGNPYSNESIVIDKDLKFPSDKRINDFYIPFGIKPPFGMSNLVFAQCIGEKVVDIRE